MVAVTGRVGLVGHTPDGDLPERGCDRSSGAGSVDQSGMVVDGVVQERVASRLPFLSTADPCRRGTRASPFTAVGPARALSGRGASPSVDSPSVRPCSPRIDPGRTQ